MATPTPSPVPGLTVKEFLKQQKKLPNGQGMSLKKLAEISDVSYSTLHRHVRYNAPIDVSTAKRLRRGTNGAISAIKTLGLEPEP